MDVPAERPTTRRSGQAIIMFALSFTFLFGLLAVAVEGGMMYVDRRQLQNAADAGALSGAYALESLPLPTYQPAHQKALQILVDNLPGTALPSPIPTTASFTRALGNGYSVTVTATGGTGWDSYQVNVSHLFSLQLGNGLGFANPTIRAMAKAQSGTYPFALILLQNQLAGYNNLFPGGNTALQLLKTAGATAGGGGFSNEGFGIGTGAGSGVSFSPCGSAGDLWAVSEDPTSGVNLAGRTTGETGDSLCAVHPASYPKPQSSPLPFPNYPEAAVNGTPPYSAAVTVNSGKTYMCSGTYSGSITMGGSGGTLVLMPGVYRFTGAGISITKGTMRTASSSSGDFPASGTYVNCSGTPTAPADGDYGVILEFAPTGCSTAQLSMSGGAGIMDITPSAKYNHISLYIELYPNLSTWQTTCPFTGSGTTGTPSGTHVVMISGGASYGIRGAIYGPGENVSLSGSGTGYGVGQMIVWTASVVGNGTLKENYDPAYLPYFRGLIQ